MFNIGDKVVYPMHGAGIIEAIEEKEVLGRTQRYYILKMPIGDMQVMIPIESVHNIGVREIIDINEADQIFESLGCEALNDNSSWNKRYRENLDKIKSGNIHEVACVVSSLMKREREKGLSTGERKMLTNAKQILISELVLAKGMAQIEVERKLKEAIH